MNEISLTDFVDVVSKSGTPKATKIAEIKGRPKYDPATDFYKPLREAIIETHQKGENKKTLDLFLSSIADKKKLSNYTAIVGGYQKWWGKKNISWFKPPRTKYTRSGFDLIVNPELGLEINGARYVVKLYLKGDQLNKLRTDIVAELLNTSLATQCTSGEILGLLDVRRSKFFQFRSPNPTTLAMIDAELAYIASIWPKL